MPGRPGTFTSALIASVVLIAAAPSSFAQGGIFQQIAKLQVDGTSVFGESVAISSDGNTLVVGSGGTDNAPQGATFVFVRQGRTWAIAAQLTGDAAASGFGSAVAISDDGGIVLVGAYYADQPAPLRLGGGAAYVFVRPNAGWTTTNQYAAKLTASDGVETDVSDLRRAERRRRHRHRRRTEEPRQVRLRRHGAAALPRVCIHLRPPASGWGQLNRRFETAELTSSDGVNEDWFGWAVAISDDGTRAIAGAPNKSDLQGEAYVFVEPNDPRGWGANTRPKETSRLVAIDGATNDFFGGTVAIDRDGRSTAVGAPFKLDGKGEAYIFLRRGNDWPANAVVNETARLTVLGGSCDAFGESVAIGGDGRTVVVGASGDHAQLHGSPGDCRDATLGPGAAYVFMEPEDGWPLSFAPASAKLRHRIRCLTTSSAAPFRSRRHERSVGSLRVLQSSRTRRRYVFDYTPPAAVIVTAAAGPPARSTGCAEGGRSRSRQQAALGSVELHHLRAGAGLPTAPITSKGRSCCESCSEDFTAKVTAAVDDGGSCAVFTSLRQRHGSAGGARFFPLCTYETKPSPLTGHCDRNGDVGERRQWDRRDSPSRRRPFR